ncbi:hypothetical protein [Clostridium sp. E02]|uniref:hypothetical protein n=1 Tax=Clostridium sp. E02 TaxID=2487134 RepID=UPI000F52E9E9|nr:hypothetical protein [Clostridium sp. E02]
METIDIEKIMQEIRQDIKEKGYTNEMLSFEDVVMVSSENKTIEEYLDLMNGSWNIQPYKILQSGFGFVGKLKNFIKKIIRKTIKFYIEPIVSEQDEFNANNVRILNKFYDYMESSNQKIEKLEIEIQQLKKIISK